MKILFTCNEYPPYPHGGQGVFVKDMAEKLTSIGHEVFVYGIYSDVEVRTILNINGVEVIKDPKLKNENILCRIKQIYEYGKNINSLSKINKIDIIEAHDNGGLFLLINHKALFVRLHNTEIYFSPWKRSRFIKMSEKFAFFSRKINLIGVSKFILNEFKSYYKLYNLKSVSVVHNGIEISHSSEKCFKFDDLRKSIVFAGTIKPVKGIDCLIQAFCKSGLHLNGYELHIYGKDTLLNNKSYIDTLLNLNSEVKKLVDSKKIIYMGVRPRNEIFLAFKNSKLCVFPSHLESFGLVVIEAMSQGVLVLYTDQGPAKEIINDGHDGFLVMPNKINELAKKMSSILELPNEQKNRIKKNAMQKAELFTMEECARKTLKLYSNAIN